jgi:hypothetical protein
MSQSSEASDLHTQAATDHEAPACHDQNKLGEAKGSAKSEMECCKTAQSK